MRATIIKEYMNALITFLSTTTEIKNPGRILGLPMTATLPSAIALLLGVLTVLYLLVLQYPQTPQPITYSKAMHGIFKHERLFIIEVAFPA